MIGKRRRVVGLGEGPEARKAIDLALRHPKLDVISIEKAKTSGYWNYLKERGLTTKPPNLTIKTGMDAVRFLESQKANSLNHVYAHFLLQHMKYAQRQKLLREIMRTLEPGGMFVTIEDIHYFRQVPLELGRQGFSVSKKRITPEQLLNLKTNNADMNAMVAIERRNFLKTLSQLPPEMFRKISAETKTGEKSVEDIKHIDIEEVREKIRENLKVREGKNPLPEVSDAIKLVLADLSQRYSEQPFVVITARKAKIIQL